MESWVWVLIIILLLLAFVILLFVFRPQSKSGEIDDPTTSADFVDENGRCIFGNGPNCPAGMMVGSNNCCIYDLRVFEKSLGEKLIEYVKQIGPTIGYGVAFEITKAVTQRVLSAILLRVARSLAVKLGSTITTRLITSAAVSGIPIVGQIIDVILLISIALDLIDPFGFGNVAIGPEIDAIREELDKIFANGIQEQANESGIPISYPIVLSPITTNQEELTGAVNKIVTQKMGEFISDPDLIARFPGDPEGFIDAVGQETIAYFDSPEGELYLNEVLCEMYNGVLNTEGVCTYTYEQCKNLKLPPSDLDGEKVENLAAYDPTTQSCIYVPYGIIKQICEKNGTTYNFDTRNCNYSQDYCISKGLDYENGTCRLSTVQQIFEAIIGQTFIRGGRRLAEHVIRQLDALIGNRLAAEIIAGSFWGVTLLIGFGVEIVTNPQAILKAINDAIVAGNQMVINILTSLPNISAKLRAQCNEELPKAQKSCLSGVATTYEKCINAYEKCIRDTPRLLEWTCAPAKLGCEALIDGVGSAACNSVEIVRLIGCDGILNIL